ncbi:MAG: hypothetical protein ACE5HE_07795 [Phycisphaerae bacterium]
MRSTRTLGDGRYRLIVTAVVVGAAPGLVPAAPTPAGVGRERIVHRFDFDELKDGNLEDIPKYWTALHGGEFPNFALGAFAQDVGRTAPPSFHLSSEGRNAAYRYSGPETRIRENSEYRIEGFIRVENLTHARACLSAELLDGDGRPLAGTLVRSRYVGGADAPRRWHKVELHLPAAPPEARTIGLTAWVLQEASWDVEVPFHRHIRRVDVRGEAWFDDITIHALPRVELTTGAVGNVLPPGEPARLQVILADDEDAHLDARLSIVDAAGTHVHSRRISAQTYGPVTPTVIALDHLPPGLYDARLDVLADLALNTSRTVTFARLAHRHRHGVGSARPFGLVIEPKSRSPADVELALLRQQEVRSVKLPVWTGLPDPPPTVSERNAAERLLQALAEDGFAMTGVFFGPPAPIVRADGPFPRRLVELLAGPPSVWRDHLAAVAAPYASIFRWWQIGHDEAAYLEDEDQLVLAITQFRDAMGRFITSPSLASPATTMREAPPEKRPVQQLALSIGYETQPEWISTQVERFRALGYESMSAFIMPLPEHEYRRIPRLANWAQRVLMARHAGVDAVFVPQTWGIRETPDGTITEPKEEYLLLRTIADIIADAVPAQRVQTTPNVVCLAFNDGPLTVLALWDVNAPEEGSRLTIQLGEAERQIDLWGRVTPLTRDARGRQIVTLSAMPVLVDGVDRSLIDLRTAVSMSPDKVESGTELVRHTLEMANRGTGALSGGAELDGPDGWDITPRTITFNMMPQQTARQEIEVHYPHNEPAGSHIILVKITLAEGPYYLEVPLPILLGLKEIDVWGMATIEGSDLVLRHVVTNKSNELLHFRGAADVPGRERQYRPVSGLRPGDTQTVLYRFADGAHLSGTKVRLGLREINDGQRTHALELVVP